MKRRIHSVKHQPKKVRKKRSTIRRFSDAAINQIRHDYEKLKLPIKVIARAYLTTASHVKMIINRKIYKDVS